MRGEGPNEEQGVIYERSQSNVKVNEAHSAIAEDQQVACKKKSQGKQRVGCWQKVEREGASEE